MQVASGSETVSIHDGVAQLAFDLGSSEAAYLIISRPSSATAKDEFFGEDHYVEVKDQLYGRYGGLAGLTVESDRQVTVRLREPVPGVGTDLFITTAAVIEPAMLNELEALERG